MTEPLICDLANRECEPCKGGVPPFTADEIKPFLAELGGGWSAPENHHLHKQFDFDDFMGGLEFVKQAAQIAEEQGHHPDLHLSWGKVIVKIWTHKIDGLVEADFILAAKLDQANA